MERKHYIVCYDIANEKRLAKVGKTMEGFGQRVQYSVFHCELSPVDLVKMREALRGKINALEDRVLLVDLGAVAQSGQLPGAVETLGEKPELPNAKFMIF